MKSQSIRISCIFLPKRQANWMSTHHFRPTACVVVHTMPPGDNFLKLADLVADNHARSAAFSRTKAFLVFFYGYERCIFRFFCFHGFVSCPVFLHSKCYFILKNTCTEACIAKIVNFFKRSKKWDMNRCCAEVTILHPVVYFNCFVLKKSERGNYFNN